MHTLHRLRLRALVRRPRLSWRPALCLVAPLMLLVAVPPAQAQAQTADVLAGNQCGQYVEAFKTGAAGYSPYLQAVAEVARSRDAQEGKTLYVTALNASAPAANALWLNNWCSENPLKRVAEASSRLLDELTGQQRAAAPAPAAPAATQIVVVPTQPALPSSCRVGNTKFCAGCSISCNGPAKAVCKQGTDFLLKDGPCAFQSSCKCLTNGS